MLTMDVAYNTTPVGIAGATTTAMDTITAITTPGTVEMIGMTEMISMIDTTGIVIATVMTGTADSALKTPGMAEAGVMAAVEAKATPAETVAVVRIVRTEDLSQMVVPDITE
ncbi:hypothetical protein FRB93_007363 [Tulasnella sp. JGI-2019a]|nr:hypothetical protein FRB93_007363 [Tulasnella sp. JGI-2019a]